MFKSSHQYILYACISGVLAFIAVLHVNFLLSWFYFIPLFFVLITASKKTAFRSGFIFGVALALPSFYWMIPGAERFTGSSMIYGILVFLFSTLLLSLYFAFINWLFVSLKKKHDSKYSFIVNAILIAAIYSAAEALFMNITSGMPWFGFHSGNGLLANIYTIQPASVFGMHILSFVIVLINYLFAYIIAKKRWIFVIAPITFVLVYFGWGYFLLSYYTNNHSEDKPVRLSLLNQNIKPEIKWDDKNGNQLVASLLALDSIASLQKPDIILWSESAVPWTYRPNDDLVKEILRISSSAKPTHLLGINTDYSDDVVYNSVYALNSDGKVLGRYDKTYLLSFIESSIGGFSFPFFSSGGFMVEKGENNDPLQTKYGNIGVMVCNESVLPQAASMPVKNGADFLVNLSNDGWFNNTYLADLHFWNVKLRAVETRRDVAVCSNNGYTGLVHSSGEVAMQQRADESFVKPVTVYKQEGLSLAAAYPFLLVYICLLYIFVVKVTSLFLTKPAMVHQQNLSKKNKSGGNKR